MSFEVSKLFRYSSAYRRTNTCIQYKHNVVLKKQNYAKAAQPRNQCQLASWKNKILHTFDTFYKIIAHDTTYNLFNIQVVAF